MSVLTIAPSLPISNGRRKSRTLFHILIAKFTVNVPVRLFPLIDAVNEPLSPACSPATDVACPFKVAP